MKKYEFYAEHGFTLELTREEAEAGSHPGPCDDDIEALLSTPNISGQFETIPAAAIRAELEGYGAWDEAELSDDDANRARILWIACGDVVSGQIEPM